MNEEQFKKLVKFFNDKHLESKPMELWDANTLKNLPRITKDRTIWKLLDKHVKEATIMVGASPSLKEDVKELAKLESHPFRNRFIIIVVNAALKVCLEHGVKPDYVIAIDGNPRTLVGDLDCDNENLTLMCSNNVAPKIFKVWKGKEVWWLPYYSLTKEVAKKVRRILGKKVPSGGNAFSSGMGVAYGIFGSRIFIMVGSEHCYDDQYYAHKRSKWESVSKISHFKVLDIKGRERWTNIPLWQYKIWIEHMAKDLPHVHFIDTSFGILGTDTDRIAHLPISEAIEKTIEAFNLSDAIGKDPILYEKARYDAAYSTGKYIPTNGIEYWKYMNKSFRFGKAKKILDVGTGIGQVVAYFRNHGYEAYGTDISEKITKYWHMGNIAQFCKVCPANELPFEDGFFDIVACTEVLEHIPAEKIVDSLKEIRRVGSGDFIFSYALGRALHKMPHDGSEPHITIKPVDWWAEKFREAGFVIIDMIMNRAQTSCSVIAVKRGKNDKGKLPTQSVFLQSKDGVFVGGRYVEVESRY